MQYALPASAAVVLIMNVAPDQTLAVMYVGLLLFILINFYLFIYIYKVFSRILRLLITSRCTFNECLWPYMFNHINYVQRLTKEHNIISSVDNELCVVAF